jgi:hypothetical protein
MQTQIIELSKLATPKQRPFGEFLVEERILDRFQLFRALQLQDRMPGELLGHCAATLGYVQRSAIELLHLQFARSRGLAQHA